MERQTQRSGELDPPPLAVGDPQAREILRVWAGSEQMHISLVTAWVDPGHWGLVLADVARHVANAYAKSGDFAAEEAAARIKLAFEAEWTTPTDSPTQLVIQ